MIFTKTVEEKDYTLIKDEVEVLERTFNQLSGLGVKLDAWNVSHAHRKWEWGMAIKALTIWYLEYNEENISIVDVGSGDGLLAPAISCGLSMSVTEIEPREECYTNRVHCNSILTNNLKPEIKWIQKSDGSKYDVVFSISVMEHVVADHVFLKDLADMVKPSGLLFITTDVMPTMPGKYHFDNLREHNYVMFDILNKVRYLESVGFESFGESDFAYKGNQVFDYSFCSLAMVKK